MFRPLTRKKQEIGREECLEILKQEVRGVLSLLGDEGYPYGTPTNHYYREEDGCIYFHSGKTGHKIDAIGNCDKASYCVMDEGHRNEGEWALHFRSVIVFGRIEMIEDPKTIEDIVWKLSLRFTDDRKYIQDAFDRSFSGTAMFRLVPEHITGKRVNES